MKNDKHGCSTCPKGEERFEEFQSVILHRTVVQYDYRTEWGELFSTLAKDLETARAQRDSWLAAQSHPRAGCCEDTKAVDPYNRL